MVKFKYLIFFLFFLIHSCEFTENNYFPSTNGLNWVYSVVIKSSYTGKSHTKRIMVTNLSEKNKNNEKEFSRLYSDGSYYSYEIDNNKLIRTSVILAFSDGIDEPVQKTVYPDLNFNQKEWIVREQLFLVKGFQPPLLNVRPSSQFDMKYKVKKKYKKYKFNKLIFNNCIEIEGSGSTNFIGDTRSGPINVKIKNNEVLCNDVGLVKQIRSEDTNASAFGNMTLIKKLMGFKK